MKQTSMFPKVTKDMLMIQLSWAGGFLGIVLLISIIKSFISGIQGNDLEGYFSTIFIAGNIFMLVLGIIVIHFLPHYVGMGVTRKDYFLGAFLASLGITLFIPIVTIIITLLEQFLFHMMDFSYKVQTINEVNIKDNIIGDIVQSIIISPHIAPQDNWFLAAFVLSINILIYYLMGWLIGVSFYRLDVVAGLISIFSSIVLKMLKDTFLRIALDLPAVGWFTFLDKFLPTGIAWVGILLIVIVTIQLIRKMTSRAPIKI